MLVADSGMTASELTTAFQDAIDSLLSNGGIIDVPADDFSALDPATLSVPTGKMVTWMALSAILPEGMPGDIIVCGYRLQPHEGGLGLTGRPGQAFVRHIVHHTPDVSVQNEQDSIIYTEGHVPSVEGLKDNEFAAWRFVMESQAFDSTKNPSSLDIKGINGAVVGNGGNSKVRSIRTTSYGINGHKGLVTGGMFAAVRTGPIPQDAPFNGNGTDQWTSGVAGPYMSGDAAVIAQVGPGIQANFRMEGFAGKERPQFGLLQGRGNQAVLPELAVIHLHGGGNGRVIQVTKDENDGTDIFLVTKQGSTMAAGGFFSGNIVVADNSVVSIKAANTSGFFDVFAHGTSACWIKTYFRVGTSPSISICSSGSTGAAVTGILNGTTGIDGNLTVSPQTNGNILIENRTGASRIITYHFTCSA